MQQIKFEWIPEDELKKKELDPNTYGTVQWVRILMDATKHGIIQWKEQCLSDSVMQLNASLKNVPPTFHGNASFICTLPKENRKSHYSLAIGILSPTTKKLFHLLSDYESQNSTTAQQEDIQLALIQLLSCLIDHKKQINESGYSNLSIKTKN